MPNSQIEFLIQLLNESEQSLLESIDEITDEQLRCKPAPDQWSIAEVIEHLTMTDFGIVQSIKKKSTELTTTVVETADDNLLAKIIIPRTTKVKAPSFLVPSGKFKTKEEAILAFQKTRRMVNGFVETTDLPLEKVVFKHFAIGLINGYGWINFISKHCQRHILQIEEIKSTL